MRTRVVIQSRLSSSRLPGKALMEVGGMPLVELVARRASRTGFEVVVATSVESYDDRIATQLDRVGIPVIRGPLDDVLARFIDASKDLAPDDRLVRLTGDNPIVDAALVQEVIDETDAHGHEYGRVDIEQVPEGLGVEVFSVRSLREADDAATTTYDREHVTPWIRRNKGEWLAAPSAKYGDPTIYRCTTDCLHDYDRVSRLFDGIEDPVAVDWREIISRLDETVRDLGSLARDVGRASRLTSVLFQAGLVGVTDEVRLSSEVRRVFAAAVDRGVSHTFFHATEAGVVAAGTLPALRQRLGAMVGLEVDASLEHGELHVRSQLERVFAHLGQRAASAVFVAQQPGLGDSPAWRELQDYREAGVVGALGVVAHPAEPITMIEGQSMVALDLAEQFPADLSAYQDSGLTVLALLPEASHPRVPELLDAGMVVVPTPRKAQDLEPVLRIAVGHSSAATYM